MLIDIVMDDVEPVDHKASRKAEADKLPPCPVCGSKAFLERDTIDGVFFMGYSVGCPRYCIGDGIHGVDTFEDAEEKHYAAHGFITPKEAAEWWKRRADND